MQKYSFLSHLSLKKDSPQKKGKVSSLWKYGLLSMCIVVFSLVGAFALPDIQLGMSLSRDNLDFPKVFLDRNGKEIYRSFSQENREWVPLHEIPEFLQEATILAEDRRFWYHIGIDIPGIIRAMWHNALARRFEEGASTLSQQIARKVFLKDEKTLQRKIREALIAVGIEISFTKEEVLEMYLNVVPYGPRINGVDVASQMYFHKVPANLSEAESLVLAMLPQNPVLLSKKKRIPLWLGYCKNIEEDCDLFSKTYQKTRIEYVLLELAKRKKWSTEKVKKVHQELKNIILQGDKNWAHSDFQHFRFFVEDFLEKKKYSPNNTKNALFIHTSIDADFQEKVYEMIREKLPKIEEEYNIHNIAVLILENKTRSPLVWIGSESFWKEEIDGQVDVLRAKRQPGSTIKPFIYASAILMGYEPPTIFYDSAMQLVGEKKYITNADGTFLGGIRMTDALAKSRNIPAVKTFFLAGGENTLRKMLDGLFGFSLNHDFPNHPFGWTLALGTPSLPPQTLANAYAILGTGKQKELCPILSISSEENVPLPSPCDPSEKTVLSPKTIFFLGDILSNIEARPAGYWRNNITVSNFNIAVKTGTSSGRSENAIFPIDNMIVGYTPKNTFLLWAGNTDGTPLKPKSFAVSSVGPLWRDIVQAFYEKYPASYTAFEKPEGIQKIQGEWASEEYKPPSYAPLVQYLRYVPELGMNSLLSFSQKREEDSYVPASAE
ncbi:transglycosylase domain-containing protein [Candidatus Peregrinibacteria bacterium]|nr:MAG: transglycosylase domain-containing protein [Candidatus Peregrinibacteria bacterium]